MGARKNAREIPRAPRSFLRPLLQAPATQARRLYVLFLKFGFSRNLGVPFKFTSINGAQLRPVNVPWPSPSPDMEAFRLLYSHALYQAQGLI